MKKFLFVILLLLSSKMAFASCSPQKPGTSACYRYVEQTSLERVRADLAWLDKAAFERLNPHLSGLAEDVMLKPKTDIYYLDRAGLAAHNLEVVKELTVKLTTASGERVELLVGHPGCLDGTQDYCGATSTPQSASDPFFKSPEKLNELNPLLGISENTIIPPFTMLRSQ